MGSEESSQTRWVCRRQAGLRHRQELCKPRPGWAVVQTPSHHVGGFFPPVAFGVFYGLYSSVFQTWHSGEGFRYFRRVSKTGKPAASRLPIAAASQSIKDDLDIAVSKTVKVVNSF